jgi:hypothetical protein
MKRYKYTFKSPLNGSIQCDDLFIDTRGRLELNAEAMALIYNEDDRLASFLENNAEDLTEYIREELKSIVHKLEVGDYGIFAGELCLLAHVWTTSKMTDEQVREVMSYITGQYSDGWGEGLEQREWREDKVDIETPCFDVTEADWDVKRTYAYAYFYVRPWNRDNYSIELQYFEEEDIPDPEPVVQSAKCELMPNGGYIVRTVYRLNSEEGVLNCIKNSGLLYSDEFYRWIKDFGTFGQNTHLYLVVVNEGLYNKILPMLGVLYKDASRANLFSIEAESGEINLEEYMEEESQDFYNDMLNK